MSAMTEAEARDRFCHVAGRHRCCASSCMAWRWAEGARELHPVRGRVAPPEPSEGWERSLEHDLEAQVGFRDTEARMYARDRGASRRGYCGLAGQVSTSGS